MNLPNLQTISLTKGPLQRVFGDLNFNPKRLVASAVIIALIMWSGELGEITRVIIKDAFIQVSAFVGVALLIIYSSERYFGINFNELMTKSRVIEVPIAAFLGAIPGCGGAVLVVTAYASGKVSFGSLVATLIGTMGDAAFILIAIKPEAAAVIIPISLVLGILTGYIINSFFPSFYTSSSSQGLTEIPLIGRLNPLHFLYFVFLLPGLFFGVCNLFQVDLSTYWESFVLNLSILGTVVGLLAWTISPTKTIANCNDHPITRMAVETSFISVWIIGGFLAFEYIILFSTLSLEGIFRLSLPYLPLIGVVLGFIPGCGPQIILTTLYINGLVPFAAIIGNSISNDGDALFPVIAISPRVAVSATLCSAIPALLVAYGFYLFLPSVLN